MPETRDPYRILQLHPSAVPELVESAYRTLARLHHPDHHGDEPEAASTMADLNWAYAILREPSLRAAYDRNRVAIPFEVDEADTQPAVASSSLSQRVAQAAAAAAERDAGGAANMILDFGRYAGMTLREIAQVEPGYLEWLRRHSSGLRYRHQIDHVLSTLSPVRSASAE
ncbi:MAG TPA: DnaJ domain-containing protein [Candidatus Limnocylindria bacterium]